MKYQILFSGKGKKNISKCRSSAEKFYPAYILLSVKCTFLQQTDSLFS